MLINKINFFNPTNGTAPVSSNNGINWLNPANITLDDGSSASYGANSFAGDNGAELLASYDFAALPEFAVIDGLEFTVDGFQEGIYADIGIGIDGSNSIDDTTDILQTFGGPNDLWGLAEITIADLNDFAIKITIGDQSGGDGNATVDYIPVTVYWHIDIDTPAAEAPTRVDYKVFARDGTYLGLMPNVSSGLRFSQDINSAGSSMEVKSAQDLRDVTETDFLLTESGLDILTENDFIIYTESTEIFVTTGANEDYAVFKNSNRIEAWLYNYWWPNGKRMFKGQVNKITYSYGGNGDAVNSLVYSDGLDLANYMAEGLPAGLSIDVNQPSQNGYVTVDNSSSKPAAWNKYGQTLLSGSISNIAAITLKLLGIATVTVSIYDAVNGILIGTATNNVSTGSATDVQFIFNPFIEASSATSYFFGVSVGPDQSVRVYRNSSSSTYSNGSMYYAFFTGTFGGEYSIASGDLYFKTYEGTLTTTATFNSQDPVSEIASDILADYNSRGGYIFENDFEATGLSLTYTWILASILDVINKILELAPVGWYYYIDLGQASIDMKQTNPLADFTIVMGKDVHQLDISLSIEGVSNQLLFTGGNTGSENLYRNYIDNSSSSRYGLRTRAKTDNRVILSDTADAIGETFVAENAGEVQETKITILNSSMDITLLTPGKTFGFVNSGNMIDDLILQIVRREYAPDSVVLTLGRLPISLSSTVQSLNRGLLNEQTIDNPISPS
jgi:hypothetical protein